jgi:hypothetical protein
LDLIVWLQRDSNYLTHFKREVPSWFHETGPNRWMADSTVQLLAVLAHQGHSGSSIGFAVEVFAAMARFQPWGPLTGADEEWGEVFDLVEGTQQNRRCSRVFRGGDGRAYDIEGRVFREPGGACYTSGDSRVFIDFPYRPTTEYVAVAAAPPC